MYTTQKIKLKDISHLIEKIFRRPVNLKQNFEIELTIKHLFTSCLCKKISEILAIFHFTQTLNVAKVQTGELFLMSKMINNWLIMTYNTNTSQYKLVVCKNHATFSLLKIKIH